MPPQDAAALVLIRVEFPTGPKALEIERATPRATHAFGVASSSL
jgi:hypothetical protein